MNAKEHKYPHREKCTDPAERARRSQAMKALGDEGRFWFRVKKDQPGAGCWDWFGAITWQGYGQLWWKGKMLRAHQVSWLLAGREKPVEPYVIDHLCKNPLCVNPDHLRSIHRHANAVKYSNSPFGINANKTHCIRGHEFNAENTVWQKRPSDPGPSRTCAVCRPYARNSRYRIDPPDQQQAA